MLCKNIKLYDINRTLKEAILKINFFDKMKEKKTIEILWKIIERVYTKNPGM